MEHDNIFRFILILGFAVVLPVGLYHRLKAHLASKREAKSATGGTRPVQESNPMSVEAGTSGRRFVQVEVEVPGTPEPR